jgi:hypothetical protein
LFSGFSGVTGFSGLAGLSVLDGSSQPARDRIVTLKKVAHINANPKSPKRRKALAQHTDVLGYFIDITTSIGLEINGVLSLIRHQPLHLLQCQKIFMPVQRFYFCAVC